MLQRINILLDGMGLVFYSPFAVKKISEGEDFLMSHLWEPKDVMKQVESCKIVPVCTGSPGYYIIDCFEGLPDQSYLEHFQYVLQLGIIVRDDTVCIRDLFDFMNWTSDCPEEQKIHLKSGYYVMTICSSTPKSGITGDHQSIQLHFLEVSSFPATRYPGVPLLCDG